VKQRTFGLSENIIQERADKLLKSFQTSFWTNQHQWIKLPFNDQFWSIVPGLNRLETLVVYSYADSFLSQLQVLLDRAPNLRCLDIRQDESLSLQMSFFQLCHSSLCIQCEVLFIRIKSRHSTIYLVKNMMNLQSLHVKRDDEKYHKRLATAKNNNDKYRDGNVENEEELIDWLKDRLPSTCLFSKSAHFPSGIVIWI
ncbi:unnamed protein product, partial [Rotaria sordida]